MTIVRLLIAVALLLVLLPLRLLEWVLARIIDQGATLGERLCE